MIDKTRSDPTHTTYVSSYVAEWLIYLPLLILGVIGVFSFHEFNLVPAENLLEISFLLSALTLIGSLRKGAALLCFLGITYVLIKFSLMLSFKTSGILDFIQAYKAFIYMLPLSFFIGKKCFNGARLAVLVRVLIALFLVKYAYSRFFGLSDRPGLYTENNFELAMLIGLFYIAAPFLGKKRNLQFVLLGLVVVLSSSRSSVVELLVAYAVLYVRVNSRGFVVNVVGLLVVAGLVFFVFYARMGAGIDRINFLEVFLQEVHSWTPLQYLTGSFPITPLSPESCARLSYYIPLFSHSSPGSCYSVILHAFVLRVIFDQGVLGLIFVGWFSWRGMALAGFATRSQIGILGIVVANAFSVSAFNNIFISLMLAVVFGLNEHFPRPNEAGSATPTYRKIRSPDINPEVHLTETKTLGSSRGQFGPAATPSGPRPGAGS